MPAPVGLQALTVALPVRSGHAAELDAQLQERAGDVCDKLRGVSSLHFGRFVLLPGSAPGSDGAPRALLLFESNFDGELAQHLAELWAEAGALLSPLLAHCEGFEAPGDGEKFARVVRAHLREASAYFVAHPGLTVARVRADARLRLAFGRFLDERRAELVGLTPRAIVMRAREALGAAGAGAGESADGASFTLERTEPENPGLRRSVLGVLFAHAWALLTTVVIALGHDLSERLHALWHDTAEQKADPVRLSRVFREEAGRLDNGLTHVVRVKPGAFRRGALRLALRVTDELAKLGSASGKLGGIDSIHCARWVLLEDGRLVFLSNYGGSFEAYLGDFIDRASRALTMIWSNTRGFPLTLAWIFAGARDEARFKRWTRVHQLPTPLWYSAYPGLTVSEVLENAELRNILATDLDDAGARRVLGMLRD